MGHKGHLVLAVNAIRLHAYGWTAYLLFFSGYWALIFWSKLKVKKLSEMVDEDD